jgi:hypothetical protein
MSAMKSKIWVLEPHCLEVENGAAKVNLFEVPGGYVVPVVFGQDGSTVTVKVRNVKGLSGATCEALYPGQEKPESLQSSFDVGTLTVKTPLRRGCAMVRIRTAEK